MALTATATQGFEPIGVTSGEEIFLLPGDPGVTYTRGNLVGVSASTGVLINATDSLAQMTGVVTETTVCPAATQAFARDPNKIENAAADKCLIPVRMLVPAGVPIFKVTFAGQADETVVTYSAANRYVECTTGFGADNDGNGGLVYVYEGPGAGEVNIQEDYDQTGGTVELMQVFHRPFNATLTTSSKLITLEGEGSGAVGVMMLGRIDIADHNNLDVTDGTDDGDWVVWAGWNNIGNYLKNLTLPVIPRHLVYNA